MQREGDDGDGGGSGGGSGGGNEEEEQKEQKKARRQPSEIDYMVISQGVEGNKSQGKMFFFNLLFLFQLSG